MRLEPESWSGSGTRSETTRMCPAGERRLASALHARVALVLGEELCLPLEAEGLPTYFLVALYA